MNNANTAKNKDIKFTEVSIEERLVSLAKLQNIDSKIDKIRIIRGELPLEVQDLEDEVYGLQTRIENLSLETEKLKSNIIEKESNIIESKSLIKKYEDQRLNVRNNREYDSLTKEIEFQNLEFQLAEKRIREYNSAIESKNEVIAQAQAKLDDRKADLEDKKNKLAEIISETKREEEELHELSKTHEQLIEPRLLIAYKRIRGNSRNGLAVVAIEREACGGCFNNIPPQRQLDIKIHKKIIVCEYCGRILIDDEIIVTNKED